MQELPKSQPVSRRRLLSSAIGAALGAAVLPDAWAAKPSDLSHGLPPVRAITRGPKHHWFAYYDKLQFDPSQRYVLGMEVDFEGRSPTPDDTIRIGMVDLQDDDRWIELGTSKAWSWQQGCMLQWLPKSDAEVIWNDRDGDQFVSRVLNVKTGKQRTLPRPIYTLSPDGKSAVGLDFHRLDVVRPGYGYKSIREYERVSNAPRNAGIYRLNLEDGDSELIVRYADALEIPYKENISDAIHWYNHLLFNPTGERFIFLNRWKKEWTRGGWSTRMFTVNRDGSKPYVVDDSGRTSHFIWRDPNHILAWSYPSGGKPGFYLFTDLTGEYELIGESEMTQDGHCSYLPGNEWILCDTYPDASRMQNPYLYELKSSRRVPLGHFYSPPEYKGEWRCDTHPRFSPDGKRVVVDSPHGGNGRQMYLIDISGIV